MSRRVILIGLIGCSAAFGSDQVGRAGWGRSGRDIVVQATVEVIPADIRSLFRRHRDELVERAVEPEVVWPKQPPMSDRAGWHYVELDIAAADDSPEARAAAAEQFPRHKTALRRYFSRYGGKPTGILPWTLIEHYDALVEAFADGTEGDVIRLSGYIMHFAGDAASPFAVSRLATTSDGGSLADLKVPLGDRSYAHRSAGHRLFGELVRRNRVRYGRLIDLAAVDYDPVEDPRQRVFDVVTESLQLLETAIHAEQSCVRTMSLESVDDLVARADQYYVLLDESGGAFCMGRLRRASLLAANLIGGAWQAAGEPTVQEIRARGSVPVKSKPELVQEGNLVGSRNSNVFHNPDCRYAKNISPDNLVYFESALDARRNGRRQCRSCKPG